MTDTNTGIIHYAIHAYYTRIKQLSQVKKKRILEPKKKGELFRRANHHRSQCDSTLLEFDASIHHVHLEPC